MVEMSLQCFCWFFISVFSVSSPSLTNITLPHAHKIKYFYSKTITEHLSLLTHSYLYTVYLWQDGDCIFISQTKEKTRERKEGCRDNGSSSNEQRSLEHTIFSKLQCLFRFFLSLQLWQSLCNTRPLSPHDWTCSHVQRGHYGESRNLMHETFIHALTLHRPKHPNNIQYKAKFSVIIIMLEDITVHSV